MGFASQENMDHPSIECSSDSAINVGGSQLLPAVFDPAPDLVSGVRAFFVGAAEHLRESDYADACPIATVALEVSSSSEPLRLACEEVFESWVAAGTERFVDGGLAPRASSRSA
jgi:hypothetical protein